jgi:hypothetical protein
VILTGSCRVPDCHAVELIRQCRSGRLTSRFAAWATAGGLGVVLALFGVIA